MEEKDVKELKDKICEAVGGLNDTVYNMHEALDRYDESIANAMRLLNTVPNETLNSLLRWGFVPGAKVQMDGKVLYQFDGFSEGMRMVFHMLDANGQPHGDEILADMENVYKHLDKFRRVE